MEKLKYSWREFASDMRQAPNWITFFRIIGFFFLLFPLLRQNYFFVSFAVFIILAATDYFDGWLARRRNIVTWLGKGLDPVADKVLLLGTILALGLLGTHPIPGLLLVTLESALLAIGIAVFFGFNTGQIVLGANLFGKAKAILEITLISFVFLQRLDIFQIANDTILFLFWAATIATVMSILGHLGMLKLIPVKRHNI